MQLKLEMTAKRRALLLRFLDGAIITNQTGVGGPDDRNYTGMSHDETVEVDKILLDIIAFCQRKPRS